MDKTFRKSKRFISLILVFILTLSTTALTIQASITAFTQYTVRINYRLPNGTLVNGIFPTGRIQLYDFAIVGDNSHIGTADINLPTNTNLYTITSNRPFSGLSLHVQLAIDIDNAQMFNVGGRVYRTPFVNQRINLQHAAAPTPTLNWITDFTIYESVRAELNLRNWDGTNFNGFVSVESDLGRQNNVQITNGRGYAWVNVGADNVIIRSQTMPHGNNNITAAAHNGIPQYFLHGLGRTVPNSDFAVTLTAHVAKQDFVLNALETATSGGIQGVVFSGTDEWGNTVMATTNSAGRAALRLPAVSQTIQEVRFPSGFPSRSQSFTLEPDTSVSEIVNLRGTANTVTPGGVGDTRELRYTYNPLLDISTFTLYLTDEETKEPISNARFDLLLGADVAHSFSTNASGGFTINNIANGTFTIRQMTTNSNYYLPDGTSTFTISSGNNNVIVDLTNMRRRGDLPLRFIDNVTSQPIEGIQFLVVGEGINETFATDDDGFLPYK